MADWVQIYRPGRRPMWGWRVPAGRVSVRDLPEDMRCAVERRLDSFRPLQIEGGKLQSVNWVRKNPFDWPQPIATDIPAGWYVIEDDDGGYFALPSNLAEVAKA